MCMHANVHNAHGLQFEMCYAIACNVSVSTGHVCICSANEI